MCPASIRMFFRFLRCDFQTSPAETGVFGLQTYPMRSERLLGTLSSEKIGHACRAEGLRRGREALGGSSNEAGREARSEVSDEEGGSPVMEKKSLGNDIQKSVPATPVALSRVGGHGSSSGPPPDQRERREASFFRRDGSFRASRCEPIGRSHVPFHREYGGDRLRDHLRSFARLRDARREGCASALRKSYP